MKQEDTGRTASELDEILGVMEKRAMERELYRGGKIPPETQEETADGEEELIVEDLDKDEDQTPRQTAGTEKPEKAEQPGKAARRATLIRPVDGLLAAFWIPVVIMIIIFIQRGIFPFGDNSFLRTDMYHQYAPFFSEFHHKLRTGGSLLYSWDVGGGVNFAALYAYYLASPVNWLVVLCPKAYIIEFMTYMIVFKIGLSGLTFAWYLRKHGRAGDFGAAFFGIFYALSGYMAAYSWNIMWLDCIWLFPLIMLGLERLVKEKKGLLYGVTLGLSILSNYYISIMICLFMVIYFVSLLILEKRKKVRDYGVICGQFAGYSLLAGGLAAAVLLPEIFALQMTASGTSTFPRPLTAIFPLLICWPDISAMWRWRSGWITGRIFTAEWEFSCFSCCIWHAERFLCGRRQCTAPCCCCFSPVFPSMC